MTTRRAIIILLVVVAVILLLGYLFGLDVSGGSGGGSDPGPVGGGY